MSKEKDPYFCIDCGHRGEHDGLITITTVCERCDSLMIVPLAALHMLDYDIMVMEFPTEDEKPKNKKSNHLRLVKDDGDKK